MTGSSYKKTIELGLRAARSNICKEDKIWSRYSNDKVNIGEKLTKVIRTLYKAFPLSKRLRALSIGSSAEPQFRILESAFRGGLYLLDIDNNALSIVKERIHRQSTDHVTTIRDDYNKTFLSSGNTGYFLKNNLHRKKVNLITFHHSLYYCKEEKWHTIFQNLYKKILAQPGAIHAVLMAAESKNQYSTTWLYNHFAGKFCAHSNNQNLIKFKRELKEIPLYKKAQIISKTNRVYFSTDDFGNFMAVIWMILLYPEVHKYTLRQREEITEFMYKKFWKNKRPLVQEQNHLVIYRGIKFKGLI